MYKLFLSFAAFCSLSLTSFGAVNAIQLQLEGDTPNKRNTISRLLTNGTSLVGDGSNVPQVVDIVTQTELTSTLTSYSTSAVIAAGYQPLDSDLTSIAALTTTSFGRGLLQDANAAALRTTAGLVIGTDVQAYDTDLADLADGSLTGSKVGFADTDSNFTATDVQSAIEELFDVNGSGPNAADGKIDWSQLVGVPAGFADGTDDGSGGGSGTTSTLQEGGVQVGDADIVTLNFGAGFDLAESPDTKITISLDGSEVFTGGDLSWSGNTPSVGANAVALGTDTTGNYVATIADSGASEITVTGSGSETAAVTLAIASTLARDSEVAAGYQPLDSDLTVIAGLADPNADRILFWDDSEGVYAYLTAGSGLTISGTSITSAVVDGDKGDITASASGATWTIDSNVISAYGRTLVDDADASTARTTLGLAIGTNVQAWDADLDDLADGTLTGSKVSDVGTSKTGTQASPSTTNPLAPTWTTEQHVIYYGITGEIDLPAVASYTNKSIFIYSTGTYTITVDPNGSEIIVENGASLGAGVADTLTATAGDTFGFLCDGVRWIKLPEGGTGTGVTDGDKGDVTISSSGTVFTVDTVNGLTDPGADKLLFWDDSAGEYVWLEPGTGLEISGSTMTAPGFQEVGSFSGTGTYSEGVLYSGTMSADATLTLSLTAGQRTGFELDVTGSTRTLTFTASYRTGYSGGTITTLALPVGRQRVEFYHNGTNYIVTDSIASEVTTTDIADGTIANIDVSASAAIAKTKLDTDLGTTKSGTFASPTTTDPLAITWADDEQMVLHYGANGEIDLPAVAGYTNKTLVIISTGTFTITVDPNGSETITESGVSLGAGTADVISGTPGLATAFYCDGATWIKMSSGGSVADVATFGITIDGGGSAITTGIKGDVQIPYGCTINSVTVLADQTGSLVVDVWKDTYANYPPTDADSITASAPPTVSSATKSTDSTLTGWTTTVTAGDTIRFNVDSATTITRATIIVKVTKN